MKTGVITVELGERSYNINIGEDLPIGASVDSGIKALVVSDTNVAPLYLERCSNLLHQHGIQTSSAVIPAGELSKSLQQAEILYSKAVDAGLDRNSVIVALGGGVVGDLAGFVAATFLRGVKFLQVPTSLLAMVDSSVGGKTAVDLPQGKNLVGAFYQPVEVVIDINTLNTLPEREYISGLAEVIKYGIIRDADFFTFLEDNITAVLEKDKDVLIEIISSSCEIKADVVALDEKESGLRAILNFGHTFAHAIETVSGYDRFLHGEAVAIGMVYAAMVSAEYCGLSDTDVSRITGLLERFGLPVTPDITSAWDDIRAAMSADKKTLNSMPRFVLAENIGKVTFGNEVPEEILVRCFERL